MLELLAHTKVQPYVVSAKQNEIDPRDGAEKKLHSSQLNSSLVYLQEKHFKDQSTKLSTTYFFFFFK